MAPYSFHFACFHCRRSFKRPGARDQVKRCPSCGELAVNLGRHFKPPKRSNVAQWEKAAFLVRSGFLFQHVYPPGTRTQPVAYPETLSEAQDFVAQYQDQAWTDVLPKVLAAMPAV